MRDILFISHATPDDPSTQISARRSKGKTFYNRQWRDLLMTAMFYFAEGNKQIIIDPCCSSNTIEIASESINYFAQVGYEEPETERVVDNEE